MLVYQNILEVGNPATGSVAMIRKLEDVAGIRVEVLDKERVFKLKRGEPFSKIGVDASFYLQPYMGLTEEERAGLQEMIIAFV